MFGKFDSFNARIANAIWRFVYVFDYLRTRPMRVCPDFIGIRERLLPPAVWNKHDVKLALKWESHHLELNFDNENEIILKKNTSYEQLRKYYSPFIMLLAPDHPILKMTSKIKRKIDDARTLRCAEMKDVEGYTYKRIGEIFGWALQENDYGGPKCSTARRYVRRGRKLRGW